MGHAQYDTDGFDQAAASRPRERVAVKGCIFKDGRMLFLFKPDAARRLSIAPDLEEDLPGGCVEAGESWQEALVREVLTRDDLKYCPHGRPICITLTQKQLEKQFKRI